MCFLCCVLAGKSGQLNPTNTKEQKGGLKTLAEKKVFQVLKCSTTSCGKTGDYRDLCSLAAFSLVASHLLRTTFLVTNATLPRTPPLPSSPEWC